MKKLSIIIPVYNSKERVRILIDKIKKLKLNYITEIIAVDDCSEKETKDIIKKINGIILITHKKNTGKGGAIKSGFEKATGDILVIQDDDLEYDPIEIPKLINPIEKNLSDVVFGSRRMNKENKYSSWAYFFGGVIIDSIISIIIGRRMTDAITGAKALSRQSYSRMKPFKSRGFEIEAEIAAKTVKNNLRFKEIAINYFPRNHSEGKNIRWHHAFKIIKAAFYYRFF